jgi:hypothetical protein
MSCKHVDILAIAILLLGMALFSTARHAPSLVMPHMPIVAEPLHRPLTLIPEPPYVTLAFN